MASRVYSASEITAMNLAMLDNHTTPCRGIPVVLRALPFIAAEPVVPPALSILIPPTLPIFALLLVRLHLASRT